MAVPFAFRALRHRNYRLYFAGQGVSLIGTWMQRVAMSWLVYRLTGSPAWLGLVGFAGNLPTFLLAPFAGAWIDRADKRRLLLATQVLAGLQALALFLLVATDTVTVGHVLALSLLLAAVNAFDMPGRQSLVVEMVDDRGDLPNAIALNSSMVNSAKLIGPSVAGLAIGAFGEAVCFGLNALSYLAVLMALAAMRLPDARRTAARGRVWEEIREGARSVARHPLQGPALLLLAIISLVGIPYGVLMPVFAKEVLQGGPSTLGFLMAAPGAGAVLGALRLASLRRTERLPLHVVCAAAIFGLALVAFSLSRWLAPSLLLLALAGFAQMTQMASTNTILQTTVDDGLRGRVMSFYTMSFQGTMPVGNLMAGVAGSSLGAPGTVALCGALSVAAALAFSGLARQRVAAPVPKRETV
ncbi:MAG: MFS transporter [Fimbriimonadales bacterium]|nr:MFS transporter [Fimbriimonadales bacterium]